jgi:hypothetical protein
VSIEEGGDEESVSLKMAASQYEGVGGYMYGGMCGWGVGPVEGRSKGNRPIQRRRPGAGWFGI